MISFALFPQASPPTMNFNISQLVFSRIRIFHPPEKNPLIMLVTWNPEFPPPGKRIHPKYRFKWLQFWKAGRSKTCARYVHTEFVVSINHFLTFVVGYLNVWFNCKSFPFVWWPTLGWILLRLKARLHYSLNAISMIQMVQYRQRGKFDRLQLWRTLGVWVGWGNILNTFLHAVCRKELNNYWWQECSKHHPPVFIK